MSEAVVKIGAGGRVVIPGRFRTALGIRPGDLVVLTLEPGGLRMASAAQAIQRSQELVARHVPEGRSLAQELVTERKEERGESRREGVEEDRREERHGP